MADSSDTSASGALPTAIVWDETFQEHQTPPSHPESPQRLDVIRQSLAATEFHGSLKVIAARDASMDEVSACHAKSYIHRAQEDILAGLPVLSTGDTAVCRESLKAAVRAAGAACAAVDAVLTAEAKNVFCLNRPPGHHATPDYGMGFCIFNNAAIAARYAQRQHKLERVLIADWDVHHGNGTQEVFYQDASVFFFSTHQSPWYPGTGGVHEIGEGDGKDTTMNRPFGAGAGREEILGAFRNDLMEAAAEFKPELVIVSAGFDSRDGDPLGHFHLSDEDFADLTGVMLQIAGEHAQGRLVSVLEGGYALEGLASAATAHCRKLHEA